MLAAIVLDILAEADPRERFYEPVAGSPDPEQHHVFVALDVHLQDDFAKARKKALGRVAEGWKLSTETVRAIERQRRGFCADYIAGQRDLAGIRNVVGWQRQRWLERQDT